LLGDEITMQVIVPTFNLPPAYRIDYPIDELRKFLLFV